MMLARSSNKPAASNAGIASQLAIGHYWPGVPEAGALGDTAHMRVASTAIYRHVRQPKYILMPMCVDKLRHWTTAWGKLVLLTEEDVRTRGLDIVLCDLAEFSTRDSDVGAEVNGSGPEAKRARRLLRECWQVGITLRPGPKLELQTIMDIGKDRGIGSPEDCFELPLPCSPESFFQKLSDAFARCCVVEDR